MTTAYDELADRALRLTEKFLPLAREEVARAEAIHNLRQREGRTIGAKRRENLEQCLVAARHLGDVFALLQGLPKPSVLRERRRLEITRAERLAAGE